MDRFLGTQLDLLALSEEKRSTAFGSEDEYVQHWQYLFSVHLAVGRKRAGEGGRDRDVAWLREYITARAAVPPRPTCALLSEEMGLSEMDVRGFLWVMLHNVGTAMDADGKAYEDRCETANLRACTGMSATDVLMFVAPDRPLMAEGMLSVEEGYVGTLRSQSYKVPREVCAAVLGVPLSPSDYLKIIDTSLSRVLEELGRQPSGVPTALKKAAEDGGGDGGDDEDLLAELALVADDGVPEVSGDTAHADAAVDIQDMNESTPSSDDAATPPPPSDPNGLEGYADNLEYLEDRFEVVAARMKLYTLGMKDEEDSRFDKQRPETLLRELQGTVRHAMRRCAARLANTPHAAERIRLERLRVQHRLSEFDMWVVITLLGGRLSQEVRKVHQRRTYRGSSATFDIGTLLGMHCEGLPAQLAHRKAFLRTGALIQSGVIRMVESRLSSGSFGEDIMDCTVEVDRRMLDYLVGLETSFSDILDSANLYTPDVDVAQVILPGELKQLITDTVRLHDRANAFRDRIGLGRLTGNYGSGVLLLFHGPPGTGKTMMANALAKDLGKKLLLISVPMLIDNPPEALRQVFREGALQNALLFFDECDSLLEARERGKLVTLLLAELERFEGLMVMATNRAEALDEALHRRITLSLEFPHPDATLRTAIWEKHVPAALRTRDVDWTQLALDYELSGGFIKNAMMNAISLALAREMREGRGGAAGADAALDPVVTGEDLHAACRQQVRGRLKTLAATRHRIVPKKGIEALVVEDETRDALLAVIQFEKARGRLRHGWGFKHTEGGAWEAGTTVLFHGPKGTGKTLAAEVVAFELARPLQVMSAMEIMTGYRSGAKNPAALFSEAREAQVVLLIEGVEGVLDTEGFASMLFFHAERAGGVVILSTTVDPRAAVTLRFNVVFRNLSYSTRLTLWRACIPRETPVADDVSLSDLARHYSTFTGAQIKAAILNAAAAACMVQGGALTHRALVRACQAEAVRGELTGNAAHMYQ